MAAFLVKVLDRKEFEEMLASHYWAQAPQVQAGFLAAYHVDMPKTPAEVRQAISDVVAGMDDLELGALSQAVIMQAHVATAEVVTV